MSTIEKRFRKNFIVACVAHALLIGGIIAFEGVISSAHSTAPVAVELVPADILGDLPTGPGYGRGAYKPPPPAADSEEPGGGGEKGASVESAPAAKEEPVPVPKAKPAVAEHADPGDIVVPKRPTAKEAKATKEAKKSAETTTKKTAKDDKDSSKASSATKKAVANAKSGSGKTGSGTGSESASSIRQRFASALAATESGTPYGDNRPTGGGNGESKYGHLGSPDGSPDGVAGGVGKGSPFWSYYLHVHDKMYEAWEQPGQSVNFDKKLVATVLLRVARSGRIDGVKLERSSGNRLMDDSAVNAARSVPQLDPLPDGLGGDFAEISVNFRLEG